MVEEVKNQGEVIEALEDLQEAKDIIKDRIEVLKERLESVMSERNLSKPVTANESNYTCPLAIKIDMFRSEINVARSEIDEILNHLQI